MHTRSYSELVRLRTFEERFDYLQLRGQVGRQTFGFERYLNQRFYTSTQWRQVRNLVIARDLGCDLACEGFDIHENIVIHHMNPMTPEDLIDGQESILDPEFLITTTHRTHNAIHYGTRESLAPTFVERRPGDTLLWERRH